MYKYSITKVVITTICIILIPFIGFSANVEHGILDLRDNDFKNEIELRGDWEFYYNELLTPKELKKHERHYHHFPELWNNISQNGKKISVFGYATYRLTILLDKDFPLLALQIPDVNSSYKMWINGEEFQHNGTVGTSKATSKPHRLPLTTVLNNKTDTIEIVLQISNFHHSKGGISHSIFLGNAHNLLHKRELSVTYDVLITGSVLISGLFFFGLFFFGQYDRAMLFFAMFCIFYAYRVVGYGNYYLHHIFPNLSWTAAVRLEYISLFLSSLFFLEFLKHIFPDENRKLILRIFEIITAFFLFFTLFFPPHIFTAALPFFLVAVIFFIVYALFVITLASYNRRIGSVNSMLSILCMLTAIIVLTLEHFNLYTASDSFIFLCYIGFFFFQSLIMSFRFSKQFKDAIEKANEAVKAKSEFLATMSHEIRTPMNGVIGMTSLLSDTPLTENQRNFVETIRISGENLITVINDILDFSKIESGKMELEKQPFEIEAALESVCDLLSLKASEKGLGLYCDIDRDVPTIVVGDVTRLKQIILNLVSNAIKFTAVGEILLKIKKIKNKDNIIILQFDVSDTGIGIPDDKRSRLFNAFSQVDASHTRKYGGTGLGLAISKKLTELMGGTIWVESEVNKGSVFSFTVQLNLNNDAYKPIAYLQNFPYLIGKKIVLISDNQSFTIFIKKQLAYLSLDTTFFTSSEFMLLNDTATTPPSDLIIVDYSVLHQIKEWNIKKIAQWANLPILVFVPSNRNDLHFSKQTYLLNLPFRNIIFRHVLKNIFLPQPDIEQVILPKEQKAKLYERYPLKILVVEDHAINQKVVLFLLKKEGYTADAVGNGLEALEAVQRQNYDLIFMDIQMPELDGLEATRQIHQLLPIAKRPIIVAMTANAMEEDRSECLNAGMDDYVSKPLREGIVYEMLSKWGAILEKKEKISQILDNY